MALPRVARNYTLKEKIGAGSFGDVFKGVSENGDVYAIKSIPRSDMSPSKANCIVREIAALLQINSPHVVRLLDVFKSLTHIYIVMEYCEGRDLKEVLEAGETVDTNLVRRWLTNVLDAFLVLEANHVMHRDLKLANVLLTHSDRTLANAKVADFGLAKYVIDPEKLIEQSNVGSNPYQAPEILRRRPYNSKVDVWSFGVLASKLLGTPLFSNITRDTILAYKTIQSVRLDLPEDAAAVIRAALTFEPKKRPSFAELRKMPYFQPSCVRIDLAPPRFFHLSHISDGDSDAVGPTPDFHRISDKYNKAVAIRDLAYQLESQDTSSSLLQIYLKRSKHCELELISLLQQHADSHLSRLLSTVKAAMLQTRLLSLPVDRQGNEELLYEEARRIVNYTYTTEGLLQDYMSSCYELALKLVEIAQDEHSNSHQGELLSWLHIKITQLQDL